EISDRIVEIDRAMRWGYVHQLGPFELWDAIGVPQTVARIENEGRMIPESVQRMLYSGATSFYRAADCDGNPHTEYFDLSSASYYPIPERRGGLVLRDIKRARGVIRKSPGASLVDVGDGVLCVEFHSKMNSVGDDVVSMIQAGIEETTRNFAAMIV